MAAPDLEQPGAPLGAFGVAAETLNDINEVGYRAAPSTASTDWRASFTAARCRPLQHKDHEGFLKLGGLPGVASALHVSLSSGINPAVSDGRDIESRRQVTSGGRPPNRARFAQ